MNNYSSTLMTRQQDPLKRRYICTRIHGITPHKTAIFGTSLVLSSFGSSHYLRSVFFLQLCFVTYIVCIGSKTKIVFKWFSFLYLIRSRLQILAMKLAVLSEIFHAFPQSLLANAWERPQLCLYRFAPLIPLHSLVSATWSCRC
jgi:hypothetical protein